MSAFLMALQYFPYVLQAVMAVEQSIGSHPGATKKAVVMGVVTAAAGVGESVSDPKVAAISGLIDTVVATLNKVGIFGKSTPAVPAK
jgi:hypothetical protein